MLGPLFFLIYIYDLKACPLSSYARMYADDTCLTASAIDPEMLQQLAVCVHKSISSWPEVFDLTSTCISP